MIKDITYCSNNSCIHRRGCKRSLSNYEIPNEMILSVFDGLECENPPDDELRYQLLIRFRLSDGSPLPKDKKQMTISEIA
jgi:hypothetical protein